MQGAAMAKIVIQREWPDGDELSILIEVADSFPDVVAEAKAAALDAYAKALGITLAGNESEAE
jgi:hypothetical protein